MPRNLFDAPDPNSPVTVEKQSSGRNLFLDESGKEVEEELGLVDSVIDLFTGTSKMTPEMEEVDEVGVAPELNNMSIPAFKASLGLLTSGETGSIKKMLREQFKDQVAFRKDEKGNEIAQLPSGDYAINKPGMTGQDMARLAAEIAVFSAKKARTLWQAGLLGMGAESALQAGEKIAGGNGFNLKDIAQSAVLEMGGKKFEDVIGAVYRYFKGRGEPVSEAERLVKAGEDVGVDLSTGDVFPPQTFSGKTASQTVEKIPIAGTGGLQRKTQIQREDAVSNFLEDYSRPDYPTIVSSVKEKSDRIKKATGDRFDELGIALDAFGETPTPNTTAAIARAEMLLNKPGVLKSLPSIGKLETLIETMAEAPQTFSSLKENRTMWREIVEGADSAERSQLSSRAKALLGSVETAMTKDMVAMARANLSPRDFQRWKQANKAWQEEYTKLTKTNIKKLLDKGEVTPGIVDTMLFSNRAADAKESAKQLYKSLTSEGRNNARAAIIQNVVDRLQKRGGVTPNTFHTEMQKLSPQVGIFFKGEERKKLDGLMKVLGATRQAQDAAVTTATGQQALGAGALAAIYNSPIHSIIGGMTAGALGRAWESKAVRDALIQINKIPAGSSDFEKAVNKIMSLLKPAAQTARREREDADNGR